MASLLEIILSILQSSTGDMTTDNKASANEIEAEASKSPATVTMSPNKSGCDVGTKAKADNILENKTNKTHDHTSPIKIITDADPQMVIKKSPPVS